MLRLVLADARKALVALAGFAGQAVALGLLHGSALHYVQLGLAFATACGVYGFSNQGLSRTPTSGTPLGSGALRKRPRHAGRGIQ